MAETAAPALVIYRLISGYTGYRRDRAREDDRLVRQRLVNELSKARELLVGLVEMLRRAGDTEGIGHTKGVLDEIDIFVQEAALGATGRSYRFPAVQRKATEKDIRRLVDFDEAIVTTCVDISKAAEILQEKVLGKESLDMAVEMGRLRQYVTTCRHRYKDRLAVLRRWETEAEAK